MGIEQSDKLKSAPVQALRAVFSGVGQLFLAADKIKTQARERTAGAGQARAARQAASRKARSQPRGPEVNGTSAAAAARARAESRWRSLDQTGNVRLLTAEEVAEAVNDRSVDPAGSAGPPPHGGTAPREQPGPAFGGRTGVVKDHRGPASAQGTAGPPAATSAAANGQAAAPHAAELPVPNYDGLSLPSLRARLRTLDEAQLTQLVRYERAHAARADVVSMFENRIAKLRDPA